ncbi:hypothetical protein HHI36_020365 [Cryptolaemus montrouzieri]|uniref:Uncharacterized protein n=1 Tax=Cryptolaemus montrouzieri TaxID=559131 RepID=A0ABD2NAI9_9CUCU
MVIICVTWILMEFTHRGRITLETIALVPLALVCGFLEQTFRVKMNSRSQRLIVIFILFLSTIMNYIFKSRFTYLLNGLNYEKSINNVDDILSKGLKIGSTKYVSGIINTTSKMDQYLQQNFVECFGLNCLNITAFKRDMATLTLKGIVQSSIDMFSDKYNDRWLLKDLPSQTQTIYFVAYFIPGHPMFPLFNRNLQRVVEAGIVENIALKYNTFHETKKKSFNSTQSLHLEHIAAPLVLWLIGFLLSLIVFIGELASVHFQIILT